MKMDSTGGRTGMIRNEPTRRQVREELRRRGEVDRQGGHHDARRRSDAIIAAQTTERSVSHTRPTSARSIRRCSGSEITCSLARFACGHSGWSAYIA